MLVDQETHLVPAGGCHAVEVVLVGRAAALGDTGPGAIAPIHTCVARVLDVGAARCVGRGVDTATGGDVHLGVSRQKETREDGQCQ